MEIKSLIAGVKLAKWAMYVQCGHCGRPRKESTSLLATQWTESKTRRVKIATLWAASAGGRRPSMIFFQLFLADCRHCRIPSLVRDSHDFVVGAN